jgi:hypothetical protein
MGTLAARRVLRVLIPVVLQYGITRAHRPYRVLLERSGPRQRKPKIRLAFKEWIRGILRVPAARVLFSRSIFRRVL